MLAFNVFGTKEIIAYVVVVIVLIIIGWYLMRGRSRLLVLPGHAEPSGTDEKGGPDAARP